MASVSRAGRRGRGTAPRSWGGGARAHSDRVAPILTAVAADYEGTPCAAWLGPEGAGRNPMRAPVFARHLAEAHDALRETVAMAALHGLPVPALASNLGYFDTMRTARGTVNMIQAQRDFFGAHGFERLDGIDDPHGPRHADGHPPQARANV